MDDLRRTVAALLGAVALVPAAGAGCARPCPRPVAPVALESVAPEPERPDELVVARRLGGLAEHVARLTARRPDLVEVRYHDDVAEWVPPQELQPLEAIAGRPVDVAFAGPAGSSTTVVVTETAGDLARVAFAGGAMAWVSARLIGLVHPPPAPPGQEPTPPAAAVEAPPPPPPRQPVDPRLVRAGAVVTVMYSGEPFLARVVVPGRGRVYVHWVADGGEEWVAASDLVRVYPAVAEGALAVGTRVWYLGAAGLSDGVVAERRSGFTRVIVVDDDPPGEWVERSAVLAVLEPVPPGRLAPGTRVGVMSGGALAGGVVVGPPEGGEVPLRWDDGSESDASLSDVVEIW